MRANFYEITQQPVEQQAYHFKYRYVLSIGEEVLAIDDQVNLFLSNLQAGQTSFEYNDPNLIQFLDSCNIKFESYMTRNQEFNILSPNPKQQRLSFIEFVLYTYREMILSEFSKRWKLNEKSKKLVMKNQQHVAQAIYSEFLEQPPYGADEALDRYTKEERETELNHRMRITHLETIVKNAEHKIVKSVKEKQAIHELETIHQKNIEERLNIMRTQINKLTRKVKKIQLDALRQLEETGMYNGPAKVGSSIANVESIKSSSAQPQSTAEQSNYVLPPGWFEYVDDSTGAFYYFNEDTGATQWERP